jgi:hypothetical protein
MNLISLVHLRKHLLPSSRSHWSATEPRSKTQPTTIAQTHSGNTHDTTAGSPTRSGWFLKPVRPLLLDLASRRQGKPVRPVWQSGQTDFVENLPKDPEHMKSLSTSEQNKPWHNRDFLAQKPFLTAHRVKPVRPVFAWTVGKNTARGKTQHFLQTISRFVPQIKVRLWG